MYTIENLFHFLHQLAAIVWLGGLLAVNVFQVRIGRGQDWAAQASLLRQSDLYGRLVVAPAAGVVLVTGPVLVAEMHLALTALWVAWGLAAIAVSLVIGATLIRATNAELRRLAMDPCAKPEMAGAATADRKPVWIQPAAAPVSRVGDGLPADAVIRREDVIRSRRPPGRPRSRPGDAATAIRSAADHSCPR